MSKFIQASEELRRVLNTQKTVTVNKLRKLLKDMNFSLKRDRETQEVEYLKGEIKKLNRKRIDKQMDILYLCIKPIIQRCGIFLPVKSPADRRIYAGNTGSE